jgi:hypothetical protein
MWMSKPPRLPLVIGDVNSEYASLRAFAGGLTKDLPSSEISLSKRNVRKLVRDSRMEGSSVKSKDEYVQSQGLRVDVKDM